MNVIQKAIETSIRAHCPSECHAAYKPHEMLVIKDFFSPDFVQTHFIPEVEACTKFIHRVKVPRFKKSGSVSQFHLQQHAPKLFQVFHSDPMRQFIQDIVGVDHLEQSPPHDPHAVALYHYTEPGDHIGVHYDKSFYKGRRYTVLLGMIQDSIESKLMCYPGASKANRRKNPMEVYTHPGTLVIFNGDVLWHEVTPLGENERRVILTMEYLTDARMSRLNKWLSDFKDRYLYFGKKPKETVE